MSGNERRIRVLHVFARMDRGGAETWIVNVLRTIDQGKFQFDFLVEPGPKGVYDEEIERLGGRIIHGPAPSQPLSYVIDSLRVLRHYGPYDVVHSHVHHFSGLTLLLARMAGIPVRIAHSHNDLRLRDENHGLSRKLYQRLMKLGIRAFATDGLAASRSAAASLYGDTWGTDPRFRILHCGVDLSIFPENADRVVIRSELNIPPNAFVVGHVGSFSPQKNHSFLLDVFREVHNARPEAIMLLLGDGPLMQDIERRVTALGLTPYVRFLQSRPDVGRIMKGAMDLFLFPSLYEGLGLALVEAQAAGLPCVISDTIPEEADVVPGLVQRMSLEQNAEEWASAVVSVKLAGPGADDALEIVRESTFNVEQSARSLVATYDQGGQPGG